MRIMHILLLVMFYYTEFHLLFSHTEKMETASSMPDLILGDPRGTQLCFVTSSSEAGVLK